MFCACVALSSLRFRQNLLNWKDGNEFYKSVFQQSSICRRNNGRMIGSYFKTSDKFVGAELKDENMINMKAYV